MLFGVCLFVFRIGCWLFVAFFSFFLNCVPCRCWLFVVGCSLLAVRCSLLLSVFVVCLFVVRCCDVLYVAVCGCSVMFGIVVRC